MSTTNTSVLIPVFMGAIGDDTIQLVNARDLHHFLEVGKDFTTWIKDRINQYGFIENQDFICVENLSSPNSGSTKARPQKLIDYHITLDMAKELAMVERNDKGKQARRYFIDCEKRLHEHQQASLSNLDDNNTSIPAAAPTRLALLKEITSNTTRFINSTSRLERETLAVSLCEMNRMAGFANRLNAKIMTELDAPRYGDPRAEQLLTQFWQHYATLSTKEALNHSGDTARLAINLPYFVKACQREGLAIGSVSELRRIVAHSQSPLFMGSNFPVWSAIIGRTVRCTVFKIV